MHSGRFYRLSLGPNLRILGRGAFASDAPRHEWSQPPGSWQAMLMHNPGVVTINGESISVAPWNFIIVPPGVRCELFWEGDPLFVYAYFGFSPDLSPENTVAIPQWSDMGTMGQFWDVELRKGLKRLHATQLHANVVATGMLWSVVQPADILRRNVYVAEAERLIAAETGPRIKVSDLARAVGLSQAQLSRLFIAEHGTTPLQFIRTAQARRAQDLLTGTVQPIKSVAAECGFPDVHAFNRFVRARLGVSPREVRAGMGTVDVFRLEEYRQKLV